jgi:hypothetical protein
MIGSCRQVHRKQPSPRRRAGSLVRSLALVSAALFLCSCSSHSGLSATDKADIRTTLTQWAGATTPAQACAVMSSGFRFFAGKGEYDDCAKDFTSTLGPLTPQTVEVLGIREQEGQVAVTATVMSIHPGTHDRPVRQVFWLVHQRGAWLLNSVGDRMGMGPPPCPPPGQHC